MTIYEIFQGDTGPISEVKPNAIATGDPIVSPWACQISVRDCNGIVIIAARTVTDLTADNFFWIVALSPSETELLEVDKLYKVTIEVTNPDTIPEFTKEAQYSLFIKRQGIL